MPHQSLPIHKLSGSRRFRQPPAWITWVLGLIFLLDVPVVLLLAFFMWWAVADNAPDIPPGCSFMNPCPSTPGERERSLVFCLGSIFALGCLRLLHLPSSTRLSRCSRIR